MNKSNIKIGQIIKISGNRYGLVVAKDDKNNVQFRGDITDNDVLIIPLKQDGPVRITDVRFARKIKP